MKKGIPFAFILTSIGPKPFTLGIENTFLDSAWVFHVIFLQYGRHRR